MMVKAETHLLNLSFDIKSLITFMINLQIVFSSVILILLRRYQNTKCHLTISKIHK